jgi:hypothetical protein
MCSLSHLTCAGQNWNIKLSESVQIIEIRGYESGDYDLFSQGHVPEVQSSNTWKGEYPIKIIFTIKSRSIKGMLVTFQFSVICF